MGTITLSPINNGDALDATPVNTNFTTIVNEFNGNVDNANVKPSANISGSKLADNSVSGSKLLAGAINQAHATATGDQNLTGSLADVTGMTATVTVAANVRAVRLTAAVRIEQDTDANSYVNFTFFKDGSAMGGGSGSWHVSKPGVSLNFNAFAQDDAPSAGSHTYKVQMSYSGGAAAPYVRGGSSLYVDFM